MNDFIDDFLMSMIIKENEIMERFLIELLGKGCECGNKNIKNFSLVYYENEFKYVLCECCKKRHYVEGVKYCIC